MVISQVTVYLAQASVLLSRKNTAVLFLSFSKENLFLKTEGTNKPTESYNLQKR